MPDPARSLKITPRIQAAAKRRRLMIEQQDRLGLYRSDPVGYAEKETGARLWSKQADILNSVVHNRRTSVMASHGTGKTYSAATAANWWFDCFSEHICYITAPTWDSAKGLTFSQLKLLRQQTGLPGVMMETGFVKDEDKNKQPLHFIRTLNAERGEAFQGEHKAPILIIIEEATGVPGYIYEAAKGLMTGPENRILLIGNPTDEATPFGAACADPAYNVLSISALDHPNILADLAAKPRPFPQNDLGLLWLKEMLETECSVEHELAGDTFEFWSLPTILSALGGVGVQENSEAEKWVYLPNPVFQGRVLGQFPTQLYSQVIPRNWMTELPTDLVYGPAKPEIGVDVARYGDDRTVICARCGPVVLSARILRKLDLAAVTGSIIDVARDTGRTCGVEPRSIPIRIDVTGGLGAGPYDFLMDAGYQHAEPVNSSSSAFETEKYPNRRSELWFSSQERLRTRDVDISRLPGDVRSVLIRELSTPKWKPNSRGQKVVEGKEITKGRLGWSPDVADAFNLAFSPSGPQAAETEVEFDPFGYEDERL